MNNNEEQREKERQNQIYQNRIDPRERQLLEERQRMQAARAQADINNNRENERRRNMNNEQRKTGHQIIKYAFILLYLIEIYFCYQWLIVPLLPLIQDIIANHGVPNISLGGSGGAVISNATSFGTLMRDSIIRIAIFSLVFALTGKLKGLAHRIIS